MPLRTGSNSIVTRSRPGTTSASTSPSSSGTITRRAAKYGAEEILEAARRCFARHGYEGATVRPLEQESGLSRGAIFNYFASKEE